LLYITPPLETTRRDIARGESSSYKENNRNEGTSHDIAKDKSFPQYISMLYHNGLRSVSFKLVCVCLEQVPSPIKSGCKTTSTISRVCIRCFEDSFGRGVCRSQNKRHWEYWHYRKLDRQSALKGESTATRLESKININCLPCF